MEIEYIISSLRCGRDDFGTASEWTSSLQNVSVRMHLGIYMYMQDVHILLPLVFDDNEGSDDDNDINRMQHDDTVIMLFISLIITKTEYAWQ